MSKKARFTFRPGRVDEGAWQIVATLGGQDDRVIIGLNSQEDCYDWINGSRRIDWLRSKATPSKLERAPSRSDRVKSTPDDALACATWEDNNGGPFHPAPG